MPWIRPQDQMPEEATPVLIIDVLGRQIVAWYITNLDMWRSENYSWWPREVTYWMSIPQTRFNMDLISRTILGYTAEVVGVSPDDILSEVKTQELVLARSIFADIAYSEYLYTYCQIGRIIKRNHATVMHNLEILAINMRARPDIKFLRTQVLNRTRDFLQH